MKITPRKHDEEAKGLVLKIISELPEKFIEGFGEATAHLSQANGGTIKIYPTPNTKSRICDIFIPEGASVNEANHDFLYFQYRGNKFLVIYT